MFGYAVRNDWLARNPCRNVKLPLVDGTRRHDLTPEDAVRIASHVAVEYQPMIWIGATLGLRWSEVAGLRVGRLDLAGGKLSVVETIVRGIGGRNVFGPRSPGPASAPCSCRAPLSPCSRHISSRPD
jgi:integrase